MLIDTHTHLDDAHYDEDREAMIARAREAGVEAFITIGCDLATSQQRLRWRSTPSHGPVSLAIIAGLIISTLFSCQQLDFSPLFKERGTNFQLLWFLG